MLPLHFPCSVFPELNYYYEYQLLLSLLFSQWKQVQNMESNKTWEIVYTNSLNMGKEVCLINMLAPTYHSWKQDVKKYEIKSNKSCEKGWQYLNMGKQTCVKKRVGSNISLGSLIIELKILDNVNTTPTKNDYQWSPVQTHEYQYLNKVIITAAKLKYSKHPHIST